MRKTGRIFISYRRDDSAGHAGRVCDRIAQRFGRDVVFFDVDAIPLGVNFVKVLREEVAQCSVLLAIIGPDWLEMRDETGQRRLDDPRDLVRIEIAAALTRDIPVIPVLLEGAQMPRPEQLPEDIRELSERNGLNVRHASFDGDMAKLLSALQGSTASPPPSLSSSPDDRLRAQAASALAGLHGDLAPEEVERLRREGRIWVRTGMAAAQKVQWLLPANGRKEWFKDIESGPEMVVVPAGKFEMGSAEGEAGRQDDEGPRHSVVIAAPFAVGRLAVTRREFAAFVESSQYRMDRGAFVWVGVEWMFDPTKSWRDPGFAQDESHPVVNVNWHDAKAYVAWLSAMTGKSYRLLSEAEWEYVARAGSSAPFWWGTGVATEKQANYRNFDPQSERTYQGKTAPAMHFEPNPWGLYNVHGNVWEWCEDTWHPNYNGAPTDGSPWLGGNTGLRVRRGGSWGNDVWELRAARRSKYNPDVRRGSLGFRVARTLETLPGSTAPRNEL